jgi:hypothetical protein
MWMPTRISLVGTGVLGRALCLESGPVQVYIPGVVHIFHFCIALDNILADLASFNCKIRIKLPTLQGCWRD